jgi:DNA-3-methyladenine glycosylase II
MAVVTLTPMPPFRLDLTVWVLRRLSVNEMDRWDGHSYRRVVRIRQAAVPLEVVQAGPPEQPRLRVTVGGRASDDRRSAATAFLRRVLGLDV